MLHNLWSGLTCSTSQTPRVYSSRDRSHEAMLLPQGQNEDIKSRYLVFVVTKLCPNPRVFLHVTFLKGSLPMASGSCSHRFITTKTKRLSCIFLCYSETTTYPRFVTTAPGVGDVEVVVVVPESGAPFYGATTPVSRITWLSPLRPTVHPRPAAHNTLIRIIQLSLTSRQTSSRGRHKLRFSARLFLAWSEEARSLVALLWSSPAKKPWEDDRCGRGS